MNRYNSDYQNSWALCIGINEYKNASPLEYAVNDASEIKNILIRKFNFDKDKVILLKNKKATKGNILKYFLSYATKTLINDRIIIFFAGHGHTVLGNRGEVGYLMPYDGNTEDLSSLLRWDDLTRNSELIHAKHIFFILDACFSGLAITRALPGGSMRFLNDMLQRYSRQVVAAGKADQTVLDSGGPIPNHSIFTGHLINGLNGKAKSSDSIITANGLMSYVTEKVSKDNNSYQTPHYGYFDGDGDLIFNKFSLTNENMDEKISQDRLFEVPIDTDKINYKEEFGLLEKIKEYISDSKYIIQLDDIIISQTKKLLTQINDKSFPLNDPNLSEENVTQRLKDYEDITVNVRMISTAISNWGGEHQKYLQYKIISRLSDHITFNTNDLKGWIALRWYPIILLFYNIGITYISKEDYTSLYELFNLDVTPYNDYTELKSLIISYGQANSDINHFEMIKRIQEYEKNYVPLNEYLFKKLQPLIEDILFMGNKYEQCFDSFEVLVGLIHADLFSHSDYGKFWGPLGRYAWKFRGRSKSDSFSKLKRDAFEQKDNWKPLKAGFFNRSFERCEKTFNEFENILNKLPWY